MRKFLSLLKTQINAQFGLSNALNSFKNDKKSFFKGFGIFIAVLLSAAYFVGFYTFVMYQIYKGAAAMNMPYMILTMAAICSGLIVLIFGIFYILSALFLAKDTEFLASLPISQGSVFMSKFVMVLIGEYPLAFMLMLPPVIIYGIGAQKGVLYYILAVICTMFLPFLPLVISSFLSLLLMNVVSRSKRRDMLIIIGSVLLMAFLFIGQNYLISIMPEDPEELTRALMESSDAIVQFVGRVFPPSVWVTRVLISGGAESALNLLYLIGISIAAFLAVYFLASLIYQRGATAQLETRNVPGKARLTYKRSSQIFTIFRNEWLILLRTPIYALNSLIMIVMVPLVMIMPLFGGNFAQDQDMQMIFQFAETAESQTIVVMVLSGFISFFAMINPAVSTTFSREGNNIWILKCIPVKPETQVYGKLLAGYSVSLITVAMAAVTSVISFKISIPTAVMILNLCGLAMIPVSAAGLYIDMIRPKLKWNNPQEAIKQNMNAVVAMLIGFVMISILGIAAYLLSRLIANVYVWFVIMALILMLVSYLCILVLKSSADKSYRKIEA